MDVITLSIISVVFLLVMIFLGVPVAFALGLTGLVGISLVENPSTAVGFIASCSYGIGSQYAWAVCPLFILIGGLANMGEITTEAFNASIKWFGRLRGGLAMATCAASGAFAACSGSTLANAAIFTPMALPQMIKHGYSKRLALGCIAASGTFAAMIPPSITMVIYGVITGEPIGKLLIAGIIPGIITVLIYMIGIYIRAVRNPGMAPITPIAATMREKIKSLKGLSGVLVIFLSIMVGIYTGWFPPSSAGAVGAFFAFLIIVFRKKFSWPGLKIVFLDTALVSSTVFIVIIGGSLFGRFWILSGIINKMNDFLMGLPVPPIAIIFIILFLFVILGCFLDPPSMMVITLPLIYPIVISLGYDGTWFGILMVKATEIAVITPPVGFNAYVVNAAAGEHANIEDVFAGIMPFLLLDLITLALLIMFPQITLWLPNTMK